jgi:S1-C subfamily serine protease
VRPAALAAIVVVSALLGGGSALVIGKASGWLDGGEAETVVVPVPDGASASRPAVDRQAAAPLVGDRFDPAELYRKRAGGVVTIFALFGDHAATGEGTGQGSGFVASEDGYILTNSHVITTAGEGSLSDPPEQATEVYVQFRDGDRVSAKIVGWDVFSDVGVLKIDSRGLELSPVPLGDSSTVVVGEPVAAIGSPFGNESSLSVGVVSATERSIDSLTSRYNLVDAIQTDAPINRGNSGGPMFNARGEVIGINAQIRSQSGNAEGVGFAVPINTARRSMQQLIATGKVRYAWVGVSTQTLTPSLARHFDLPAERGAVIQCVVEGSPAQNAGLRGGEREEEFEGVFFRPGGDLIVAINDEPVQTSEDVVRAISQQLLPGDSARVTVLRDGERRVFELTLGARSPTPDERECS